MSWTEDAVAQEKGHGGWMVDLSIGKSVRLKKGSLNFNLMITNLLNNQTIVTGGYEQNSRSSYTLDANGNVKNPRLYQFSKILRSITPGVPTACSRYHTDSKEQFLFNIKNREQSRFSITIKRKNNEKDKIHSIGIPGTNPGVVYGRRLC